MRYFILLTIFVVAFATFSLLPQPVQAIFSGWFTRGTDERAACVNFSEKEFNPHAYSQIDALIEEDIQNSCDIFGWGPPEDEHIHFSSPEFLETTNVSCGSSVQTIFSKDGTITRNDAIDIDNIHSTADTNTFNGLSQFDQMRELLRTAGSDWMFLAHEMGSLYTHTQVLDPRVHEISENSGIVPRLETIPQKAKKRVTFCQNMFRCQGDSWADENYIRKGEPPILDKDQPMRCINPMNYLVYPNEFEKTYIANELETCGESVSQLAAYESCPGKYFVPCTNQVLANTNTTSLLAAVDAGGGSSSSVCEQICNPNYNERFANAFLDMNPYSKAREQVVICQAKYPKADSHSNATRYREDILFANEKTFDCQEIVTTPGLFAQCQGIVDYTTAYSPLPRHPGMYVDYKEAEPHPVQVEDPDGPLIFWRSSWIGKACNIFGAADITGTCKRIVRLKMYANRINTYAEEVGDINNLCGVPDNETYGDPGAAYSSDAVSIKTQAYIEDPNNADNIEFQALYTFTIEPRTFAACANTIAHNTNRVVNGVEASSADAIWTFSKQVQNGDIKNMKIGESVPTSIKGTDSRTESEYIGTDSSGMPIYRHRTNTTKVEPKEKDTPATVQAGNLSRFVALGFSDAEGSGSFSKAWANINNDSHSTGYNCGWWEFTHDLPPPPGCKSRSIADFIAADQNFTPYDGPLEFDLNAIAAKYNIDPEILLAIWAVETGQSPGGASCDPNYAGARGPMQIMPATEAENTKPGESFNVCQLGDAMEMAARVLNSFNTYTHGTNPPKVDVNNLIPVGRYYGDLCDPKKGKGELRWGTGVSYCDAVKSVVETGDFP